MKWNQSGRNRSLIHSFNYTLVSILVLVGFLRSSKYLIYSVNRLIGLEGRVFANSPEDLGSIPGRVIPNTLKMVLDTSLLNTQQYKVRIEGKMEQSSERSCAPPPLHLDVVVIENEPSGHPRLRTTTAIENGFDILFRLVISFFFVSCISSVYIFLNMLPCIIWFFFFA